MKKYLLFSFAFLLFFTGCGNKEEDAVIQVMKNNIKYLQSEDIPGYMSTIDKNSPVYGSTEEALKNLFELYEVSYNVDYYKVLSIEENKAVVEIKVITKKTGGDQPFQDNVSVQEHTMIKQNGAWFITSTKIIEMNPL